MSKQKKLSLNNAVEDSVLVTCIIGRKTSERESVLEVKNTLLLLGKQYRERASQQLIATVHWSVLKKFPMKDKSAMRHQFSNLSDWSLQTTFICSETKVSKIARKYTTAVHSRRKFSKCFYLADDDGVDVRVCKVFFVLFLASLMGESQELQLWKLTVCQKSINKVVTGHIIKQKMKILNLWNNLFAVCLPMNLTTVDRKTWTADTLHLI